MTSKLGFAPNVRRNQAKTDEDNNGGIQAQTSARGASLSPLTFPSVTRQMLQNPLPRLVVCRHSRDAQEGLGQEQGQNNLGRIQGWEFNPFVPQPRNP